MLILMYYHGSPTPLIPSKQALLGPEATAISVGPNMPGASMQSVSGSLPQGKEGRHSDLGRERGERFGQITGLRGPSSIQLEKSPGLLFS